MRPTIDRIVIWRHLFLQHFCAEIYIVGESSSVARIDDNKIKFKSTTATRLAGIDRLIDGGVTLSKLLSHPLAVLK